ncbi:hypothetical protein M6D93_04625 [Jatrophihabitans telluris]|uniref:RNA polymerase sigma-70 region 2 domain-containing protein n=1 Tax=Jatrophihabitans telluris TaxID=2038343 RepID=A0ABY4R060_9ACTN|nr:hypothetical protein [Jatrophihabitans telluris]UQX89291.1 hypothetical protein M6D93_04625 [Jatrophihabitans telluris]
MAADALVVSAVFRRLRRHASPAAHRRRRSNELPLQAWLQPGDDDDDEKLRAERLSQGDVEALMELYDEIAPIAYTWALALTGSPDRAVEALHRTFLTAAQRPEVFADRRVRCRGWVLIEVHHVAWTLARVPEEQPNPVADRGSGRPSTALRAEGGRR